MYEYSYKKKLPDVHFVGGDTQTLEVSLYNESLRNIGTARIDATFTLTEAVNRHGPPILSKTGVSEPGKDDETLSHFSFFLSETDTCDLSGKYIYQILLRDQSQNTEIYQGYLFIYPNINTKISLSTSLGGDFSF